MNILIKGVEKPEYGFIEIRLYNDRAEVEGQEPEYKDFEIEELPKTHGRLIDADELIKEQEYTLRDTGVRELQTACRYTVDVLRDAPTVIEAEE